jgi:hypothetical protein
MQIPIQARHLNDQLTGTDVRQRASDIVKLRNTGTSSSSPERSLLGHRSPPSSTDNLRGRDLERGDEDIDLTSPQRPSNLFREPPRNIFDDL